MNLTRSCRITGRQFEVSAAEIDLIQRICEANPFTGGELPLPNVSPTETLRRISVYGNLIHLFWAKSAISGTATLSRFNPLHSLKVATPDEFWSDRVDNTEFGRPYDFNRPFFEQFNDLLRTAHNLPLGNVNVENSQFINGAVDVKDSYLSFVAIGSSDCLYCFNVLKCTDLIDCCFCDRSTWCYASSDLANCYQCQHCRDCEGCQDCFGCWDCRSCQDCFGCFGLERQRFCYFNRQLSELEFRKQVAAAGGRAAQIEVLGKIEQYFAGSGHRPNRIVNCENSTGAYLRNCGNMEFCFNSRDSSDCGYLISANGAKDCWRGFYTRSEFCYTGVQIDSYNCHFSYHPFNAESCWYCFGMYNGCRESFGCVGLKKKSYCILNHQYSKAEYYELLPRIAAHMRKNGEWGEWFPAATAPYSYQEGWTTEYFQEIPETEIVRRGFINLPFKPESSGKKMVAATALPDQISEFDIQAFGNSAICCVRTGQPFSLQKREVEFYRRFDIPLPQLHWRERILDLVRRRERIPDGVPGTN